MCIIVTYIHYIFWNSSHQEVKNLCPLPWILDLWLLIQYNTAEVTLCQFPDPDFKKLAVSTSCHLERSLLEPSHHALRKPKTTHREAHVVGTVWKETEAPGTQSWLSSHLTTQHHLPAMRVNHLKADLPACIQTPQLTISGDKPGLPHWALPKLQIHELSKQLLLM